ncbi:hypothetical protein [Vibrio parahaemolyticus]|uniref:hypothetical protein n=1 Tax=Vibrio parahaemolyticus TaxID=670 RepID=UPI000A3C9A60|nr:hypothetical protein [Vibrio parahaemolyticus]ELA6983694.1 hypothetical protein [Vibrio parahaemolyticus]MBE4118696.1 hypothetical protein [Vibrio parahaemolyticus]MBE4121603.1 hypothetical protein [Vibrio parahaemolyticus]MBE5147993.1 hypothetical protein [Vibrio parahaemolyticus]OUD21486.1 hypothetical protein BUN10_24065 [Vibrio parahaemolyticus]
MELAIKNSAVSAGASKGEYSVSSGEIIDSNVSTQTHVNSTRTITSNGPEISEISTSTTTKTVFWVRFDNGRELKYTINSEIDVLKGQRVSLLFIKGKKESRLVGIANHNSNQYTDMVNREIFVKCLRPNRDKIVMFFWFLLGGGLTKYFIYNPLIENNAPFSMLFFACLFGGAFLFMGVYFVISLFTLITDSAYRTFRKEVKQNLIKILTDGANQ